MPAENEGLEGEHQRLKPQYDRVHERESVDSMNPYHTAGQIVLLQCMSPQM
jgi:hypothetical protein